MKKLLGKNSSENTLVHVVLRGRDAKEYECAGVLIKEDECMIRVAFNAIDNKVKDYLDIQNYDIINISVLNPLDIDDLS